MHRVANVLGTEFRAKYMEKAHPNGGTDWYRGLTVWSPNINIFTPPGGMSTRFEISSAATLPD